MSRAMRSASLGVNRFLSGSGDTDDPGMLGVMVDGRSQAEVGGEPRSGRGRASPEVRVHGPRVPVVQEQFRCGRNADPAAMEQELSRWLLRCDRPKRRTVAWRASV
jgi:hypothetical protein